MPNVSKKRASKHNLEEPKSLNWVNQGKTYPCEWSVILRHSEQPRAGLMHLAVELSGMSDCNEVRSFVGRDRFCEFRHGGECISRVEERLCWRILQFLVTGLVEKVKREERVSNRNRSPVVGSYDWYGGWLGGWAGWAGVCSECSGSGSVWWSVSVGEASVSV